MADSLLAWVLARTMSVSRYTGGVKSALEAAAARGWLGRASASLALAAVVLVLAVWLGSLPGAPALAPLGALNTSAHDGDSWFVLRRAYPTGRAPAPDHLDRVWREQRSRAGLRTQLNLPGERWVSIGPQPIHVSNNHSYAGRVTAVAPHPSNASIIYIGTDSGGIWRTTNGGGAWTSLTDSLPVPAISSLAVDPVDPQLLYATTIHRTYPTRLLRSADGGATWTVSSIVLDDGRALSPAICSVNVFKACIPPSSVRLFLDPRRAGSPNTSTVYFIASSHLLRSDDSGRTFRIVLALPVDLDFSGAEAPNLNREALFLRDAVLDPTRPDRLYVAVVRPRCLDQACTTADGVMGIYRSLDGGGHWTTHDVGSVAAQALIYTRYADPGSVYVPRMRLAVAASSPDILALAVRDQPTNRVRVFRSTDAGAAWTETPFPANSLTWPLTLAFAPSDANTMYVGSNGVYRSTNGGQTWTAFAQTHADNISVTFTASGTPIIGGDGGLYFGSSTTAITPIHGGLPITEFYSLAAHPTNPLLLAGGTQDNGTVIFQGNVGWSLITGGDGGDVVFDPTPGSNVLYAMIEWYFDFSGGNVFQFYRCQAAACPNRVVGLNRAVDGPFIPRLAMDPSSASTLWLTAEHMFRTDNRADTWVTASPSVGTTERCWQDPVAGQSCARGRYFTAVGVAPSAPQTVYSGALNGDVWKTTNRGATWASVAGPNAGPLPVRAVNDIVVDPLNAQIAYVSYSGFDTGGSGRGHVFRTTDGGATWQDLSGNLPDVPVNTLLIDPDSVGTSSSRVLYAGTDIGVFRVTLDGTANWQSFGTGLPPVVVNRLTYNTQTRQLLAATYGRGVWAISSRFTR